MAPWERVGNGDFFFWGVGRFFYFGLNQSNQSNQPNRSNQPFLLILKENGHGGSHLF